MTRAWRRASVPAMAIEIKGDEVIAALRKQVADLSFQLLLADLTIKKYEESTEGGVDPE